MAFFYVSFQNNFKYVGKCFDSNKKPLSNTAIVYITSLTI